MDTVKIAILGLGGSIREFRGMYDVTIGVNDIWRYCFVNHIVCLDRRDRFTPERLMFIDESKPGRFYTQIPEWSTRPDYFPITLQHEYPNHICQLDLPQLPKSLCSPFVAAAIAYKFHAATEIHLFGVDLINHPNLHDGTLIRIKMHFTNLRDALKAKGIALIVHGDGILKSLNI